MILWGHNPTDLRSHQLLFSKIKQNGTRFIVVKIRAIPTPYLHLPISGSRLYPSHGQCVDGRDDVVIMARISTIRHLSTHILSVLMKTIMPEGVPANESLVAYPFWRKRWDTQNAGMGRKKLPTFPAQSIRQLARDYATTKPAALIQGWGPQRHICGERTSRRFNFTGLDCPGDVVASKVAGRQVTAVVLIVNSALDQICQKIRYKRKSRL